MHIFIQIVFFWLKMPKNFFGGMLQTAGAITLKVLSFLKLQFEAEAYRFSRSYFIAQ